MSRTRPDRLLRSSLLVALAVGFVAFAVLGVLFGLSSRASADGTCTIWWTGAGSDDLWSDTANWAPNEDGSGTVAGPPGASDFACMSTAATAVAVVVGAGTSPSVEG